MYRENETPYAIINILIIIIYINWISSLDKIGPDMDHTLGYIVGWGCGTGTCRHGGTHHCMNRGSVSTPFNSLWYNSRWSAQMPR